jgi:hypothetical protein
MNLTKRVGLLGGAAALTFAGVGVADDTTGAEVDYKARLAAAEAKIAQLEAQSSDNWLTEQRSEEIRNLVHDVLADADTRSSMLQSSMTAGYDNGAVIGSSDGNWLLRVNMLMQQRFAYNNQSVDDDALSNVDEDRWGFENTRTAFNLSGHVVNPDWFYNVRINVGNNDGDTGDSFADSNDGRVGTQWAYLGYDYGNGWKVMMGQMKAPLLREELINAEHQQAVERSNINYMYTGGYTQGLAFSHEMDQMRYTFAYNDGARTGNLTALNADTEYAFTGRLEFLFSGTWGQFDDFTSPPGDEQGVMVGVAGHYQKGEYGFTSTTGFNESEVYILTADVSLEFGGGNIYAAVTYLDNDTESVSGLTDVDTGELGFLVQGGLYLNDEMELFARYEYADVDRTGFDDLSIMTVGLNWYFAGHNAKWTTDIGYAFDQVPTAGGLVGGGVHEDGNISNWRGDEPVTGDDGQIVFRTQWQILF